jgi:hypothetical protein
MTLCPDFPRRIKTIFFIVVANIGMPPGVAVVIILVIILVPATIVVCTSKLFLCYFVKKLNETRQLLNLVHLIITSDPCNS